jgi:hypothetical protein
MDDYDDFRSRKRRRGGVGGKLILIGVIIVIVLATVFYYYFSGGPINITAPTTLTVNSNGAVFAIAGKSYVATLAGYNNNTKTAYVYVSEVPVFLGPVLNVTLHQNSTVKVNYDSQYSIMQMTFISGGKSSAQVLVAPLAASLQVDPDYQYIGHPNVTLPGLKITVTTTVRSGTSNVPTTTVGSGSVSSTIPTTTATTTVAPTTTTISAVNSTQTAINTALANDPSYGLMLNYTTLYVATLGCTQSVYRNSYFESRGSIPSGPVDYYNVSYETPYGMVQKMVSTGGGNYNVKFLAQVDDPQFNNSAALTISLTVNPSGSRTIAVVNSNVFGGIFTGATYSDLSSEYTQTQSVGNACAALVG